MSVNRAPDYDDKTDEGPLRVERAASPAPVLEPNEARGATTHHNVRYVLAISVAVLIVAFAIVYFAFFSSSPTPVP